MVRRPHLDLAALAAVPRNAAAAADAALARHQLPLTELGHVEAVGVAAEDAHRELINHSSCQLLQLLPAGLQLLLHAGELH